MYPITTTGTDMMHSMNKWAVPTSGAIRMTNNLYGRGVQLSNNPTHGILYLRWVHDNRGNLWGDPNGDTAFYMVPEVDLMRVTAAMQQGSLVSLIIRRHDVDYNYGTYRIMAINPWSTGVHRVALCRATVVQPSKPQKPADDLAVCHSATMEEDIMSTCTSSDDDDDVYVVARITGHRKQTHTGWEFQVKWKGFREKTWEPLKHLVHNGKMNTFFRRYCRDHGLSRPLRLATELQQ